MTAGPETAANAGRWIWWLVFGVLALYVAVRLGIFALWADTSILSETVRLPNTFASVDHPFHVARAEMLWRELSSGQLLRWMGQHQGGYPVEFYPLGEAWLEVFIRAASLGTFSAQGTHTVAVIALFLAPGIAFATLARVDGWSPAAGLIALVLHISLPGSWYDGGYTELVQWGLVTNVAGAVAALLMVPVLIRFLTGGEGWAGGIAALLAAAAVYSNPRSLLGLAALGGGAWLALALRGWRWKTSRAAVGAMPASPAPRHPSASRLLTPLTTRLRNGVDSSAGDACIAPTSIVAVADGGYPGFSMSAVSLRSLQVAVLAALLAAPELIALARFGDLYAFVRYSGYDDVAEYARTAVGAITWPVIALGSVGVVLGLAFRRRLATTAAALALALYVLLTLAIAFVPAATQLAPQLEPTRLMPLQRLLTIYLAAVALWAAFDWIVARIVPKRIWVAPVAAIGLSAVFLLVFTRPLAGPPPDPASSAILPVSLYPVATSARPEQADLETAVRAADESALPGTALLVLGSAVSWHQQLWSPFWTERPLFYDNWLWYWRPDHAGTPGYTFLAGHHYPDPEQTLQRDYLARHGIGAVVVTGPAAAAAANSPLLEQIHTGVYDAYAVREPVTKVTFGDRNAATVVSGNQRIEAVADTSGDPIVVRANWHPRWEASVDGVRADVARRRDGYLAVTVPEDAAQVVLVYTVQPLDWAARLLAGVGLGWVGWLAVRSNRRRFFDRHWYPRRLDNARLLHSAVAQDVKGNRDMAPEREG